MAHGPSRSAACGIFPDQGSNPCPLHWQADSQPLRHQGSPCLVIFYWLLDMVKFIFLSAAYFNMPVNILEPCFGMSLGYLTIVWSFLVLFLSFLGKTSIAFSLGLIFLHYQGKTFLSILSKSLWDMKFSPMIFGSRNCFWSCLTPRYCFLQFFQVCFSLASGSFLTFMWWLVLRWTLGRVVREPPYIDLHCSLSV